MAETDSRTRAERLSAGRVHGAAVAERLQATSRELESIVAEQPLNVFNRSGARRRGRADLFSVMEGTDELGQRIVVIDEIKRSDWGAMARHRVRPNIRRYVRQLWRYIEAEECEDFEVVMAAIHFPARPRADRAAEVEAGFAEEGISVVWGAEDR